MDGYKESAWIALSLAVSAGVIGLIVILSTVAHTIVGRYNEQTAYYERVEEVREYLPYDMTTVESQDVVAAIMKYQGTRPIYINNGGNFYFWCNSAYKNVRVHTPSGDVIVDLPSQQDTAYTLASLQSVIPARTFTANVIFGGNGEFLGLYFY